MEHWSCYTSCVQFHCTRDAELINSRTRSPRVQERSWHMPPDIIAVAGANVGLAKQRPKPKIHYFDLLYNKDKLYNTGFHFSSFNC